MSNLQSIFYAPLGRKITYCHCASVKNANVYLNQIWKMHYNKNVRICQFSVSLVPTHLYIFRMRFWFKQGIKLPCIVFSEMDQLYASNLLFLLWIFSSGKLTVSYLKMCRCWFLSKSVNQTLHTGVSLVQDWSSELWAKFSVFEEGISENNKTVQPKVLDFW